MLALLAMLLFTLHPTATSALLVAHGHPSLAKVLGAGVLGYFIHTEMADYTFVILTPLALLPHKPQLWLNALVLLALPRVKYQLLLVCVLSFLTPDLKRAQELEGEVDGSHQVEDELEPSVLARWQEGRALYWPAQWEF